MSEHETTRNEMDFISKCRKGLVSELDGTAPSPEELSAGFSVAAKKGHFRTLERLLSFSPSADTIKTGFVEACCSGSMRAAGLLASCSELPPEAFIVAYDALFSKQKSGMTRALVSWAKGDAKKLLDERFEQISQEGGEPLFFQKERSAPSISASSVEQEPSSLSVKGAFNPFSENEKTPATEMRERKKRQPKIRLDAIVASASDDEFFAVLSSTKDNFALERAFVSALKAGRAERACSIALGGLNPFHKGRELLEASVEAGSSDAIEALVSAGMKPQGFASSAYAKAISARRFDLCALIERKGFDVSADPGKWTPIVWELPPEAAEELWRVSSRAKAVFQRTSKNNLNPIAKYAAENEGKIDYWRLRNEPEFAHLSDDEFDEKIDRIALTSIASSKTHQPVIEDLDEIDRKALEKANRLYERSVEKNVDLDELDRRVWAKLNAPTPAGSLPSDEQSAFFKIIDGEASLIDTIKNAESPKRRGISSLKPKRKGP